jgi:phosphate acetyltransferase
LRLRRLHAKSAGLGGDNVSSVSRRVYVASPEGLTGKSAIALGLLDALTREVGSVGIFRPLTTSGSESADVDLTVDLLVSQPGISQSYEEAIGITYDAARKNADEALHIIVERFGQLTDRFEVILVVGSDYADVTSGTELSFNAKIAANLGSPVVLVVHGQERTAEQIRAAAAGAIAELRANHAQTVAVIANRVDHDAAEVIRAELAQLGNVVTAAIPESPLLRAPTFRALADAVDGELVLGSEAWMNREALSVIVAAMSLPHVLDRLLPDVTVIAPSDRTDLLPALMLAHQSGTFPTLSGILLTGGYELPELIRRLSEGVQQGLPIVMTKLGTFTTAERVMRARGPITKESSRKIETARRVFAEQVDQASLLSAIDISASDVRTPLMFEHQLMERARADRQRIVLPESEDDRILEAASILLWRGVANLILLGDETKVRARASVLGLDLDEASVVSPTDPVATLSYSTGASGSGAEVERVRAATELVRRQAPDLPLEGPIQYDAAIDPEVARTKLPDSPVAGRATVFIFPDLNTGNNTYKAVQRSAHAIAIGPVLQGLRKPVNDLSGGALVDDIVYTVAITAVQAQAIKQGRPAEAAAPGSQP